jgi:hypothetical protein
MYSMSKPVTPLLSIHTVLHMLDNRSCCLLWNSQELSIMTWMLWPSDIYDPQAIQCAAMHSKISKQNKMQVTFVCCVANPNFQYIWGNVFASVSFQCDEHAERDDTRGQTLSTLKSFMSVERSRRGEPIKRNLIRPRDVHRLHFRSRGNNCDWDAMKLRSPKELCRAEF